jgi:hypothetical protein
MMINRTPLSGSPFGLLLFCLAIEAHMASFSSPLRDHVPFRSDSREPERATFRGSEEARSQRHEGGIGLPDSRARLLLNCWPRASASRLRLRQSVCPRSIQSGMTLDMSTFTDELPSYPPRLISSFCILRAS